MSSERIKLLRTNRILKEFKEAYKKPFDIDNNIFELNDGVYLYINDLVFCVWFALRLALWCLFFVHELTRKLNPFYNLCFII